MSDAQPVERSSARALLLTRERELLLMKLAMPDPLRLLWIAPGGGVEAGESPETALRRELREETGLSEVRLGPELWARSHTWSVGARRFTQHERYWVVPVERFAPSLDGMPEGSERDSFLQYRWWSLRDILESRELFVPRRMGALLMRYLERGPPATPLNAGV